MTVVRKSDSHQGGVKGIRKICQLIERYFSLCLSNHEDPRNSKEFPTPWNFLKSFESARLVGFPGKSVAT